MKMKKSVRGWVVLAVSVLCTAARAGEVDEDVAAASVASRAEHSAPRLKAAYRLFSIAGLEDATPVRLQGAELDAYAVSQRWLRLGVELEGGSGSASWAGTSATLGYGLVGLTAGVQYPARITPFIEGRFAAGILWGQVDGTLARDNTSLAGMSAATWMCAGGLDAGVEIYVHGRAYVSAAVGWTRSTWHGVDVAAMIQSSSGSPSYKDLVADSWTVKLGVGI